MCVSVFTRSQSPNESQSTLDHGLQVDPAAVMAVVETFNGTGGGLSRLTSSHFHLILSYNDNTHSICPNYWSNCLCQRCGRSSQLCGSSTPGSIISSHPIPMLLTPEPLFVMNSISMSREVQRSVDDVLTRDIARWLP